LVEKRVVQSVYLTADPKAGLKVGLKVAQRDERKVAQMAGPLDDLMAGWRVVY